MIDSLAVYHLSAQFPGPTTPRDFVTLLLTSSTALTEPAPERPSPPTSAGTQPQSSRFSETPRHFMVISRPCIHPDCPPRDGFIRGQYESVEFIREIPRKPKKMSSSMTDLPRSAHTRDRSLEEKAILRKAAQVGSGDGAHLQNGDNLSAGAAEDIVREGRKRGKTISFTQPRGSSAKGEGMDDQQAQDDEDTNPVEWIMITRSDPGGSVPRFMVERGTPGSIVADASKFLDWACKKEHPEDDAEALAEGGMEHIKDKKQKQLEACETNSHLAGTDGSLEVGESSATVAPKSASLETSLHTNQEPQHGGLFSSVVGASYAGLRTYAPQAVIDRLPRHQQASSMTSSTAGLSESNFTASILPSDTKGTNDASPSPTASSASSIISFASAEDHFDGQDETLSTKSTTSNSRSSHSKDTAGMSPRDKELAKLHDRKRQLNEKLTKAREKQAKDKEELTSKEEAAIKKAEEKHQKEVQKQEERYKKEIAKLEAKRQKEAAKLAEQKKKAEDKDEKSRLTRERDDMKQELEVVSKERDILQDQVGALQRENTSLVVRLGKIEEGKKLLKEVKSELDGNRSRSSSLRGKGTPEKGKEATILGGEKQEGLEAMK
jgi:predicted  nucleic acid-binding Zn-ribbon protein